MTNHSVSLTLLPDNAQRLVNLCGRLNEHIQQIEADMALKIRQRGNVFLLTGDEKAVANGKELLEMLYQSTAGGETLNPNQVHLAVQEFSDSSASSSETDQAVDAASLIKTPKGSVKPRSNHQREY
ncbi:MAG: PhoH family protein, partial [Pseudomonadales bacterium]|nr:PhoH family protein [Pseudomonadales bacterium]